LVESCGFEADVLQWQVSRLSTGEKQRLALVRALIRKPAVLLLDETGSGLDQKNSLLLEQRIRLYQSEHQAPILWVSHAREQVERVGDRSMALFKDHAEFSTSGQQEVGRP
jgi:ABC-type iron transport system FetAB ATPase subunit